MFARGWIAVALVAAACASTTPPTDPEVEELEVEIARQREWAKRAHEQCQTFFDEVPTRAELLARNARAARIRVHEPALVEADWRVYIPDGDKLGYYRVIEVNGKEVLARLVWTFRQPVPPITGIVVKHPSYLRPRPPPAPNEELWETKARLRGERQALLEISYTATRGQRDTPSEGEFQARVLGVTREAKSHRVRIDAGSTDGVRKGDVLMAWRPGKHQFCFLRVEDVTKSECFARHRIYRKINWYPAVGDIVVYYE